MGARQGLVLGVLVAFALVGCSRSLTGSDPDGPCDGPWCESDSDGVSRVDGPSMVLTPPPLSGPPQAVSPPFAGEPPPPVPPAGPCPGPGCFEPVSPPTGACDTITFQTTRVGMVNRSLFVVFDRSAAGAAAPGADQARAALEGALREHEAEWLQTAAVFYPGYVTVDEGPCGDDVDADAGCDPVDARTGCNVASFEGSGAQLLRLLGDDAPATSQFAPMAVEARPLMQALAAVNEIRADHDVPTAVVVVTFGEPGCGWDQDRVLGLLGRWRSAGVETHVLRLNPEAGDSLAGLSEVGVAVQEMGADDPELQRYLSMVVGDAAGGGGADPCSLILNPPAPVPDLLLATVEDPSGQRRQIPREFGWRIEPNGREVTLTGELCDAARSGRLGPVSFEVACPEPPTPPSFAPIE